MTTRTFAPVLAAADDPSTIAAAYPEQVCRHAVRIADECPTCEPVLDHDPGFAAYDRAEDPFDDPGFDEAANDDRRHGLL